MSRKDERKKATAEQKQRWLNGICLALIAIIIGLSAYLAYSLQDARRAEELHQEYRNLFEEGQNATASPIPSASAAPSPTPTPTPSPTPLPSGLVLELDGRTVVLGTPDAGTIRMALPTPPSVDPAFAPLLEENGEVVGWLKVADIIDLPVVQRDNLFYLTHGLDGEELKSGALFLDEANLLYPLDSNTLIYGHNMKDGSMFGRLSRYEDENYLRKHPLIFFRTLYGQGQYVPFAAFHASMSETDGEYFEIRRLSFAMEDSFRLFVEQLRSRSLYYVPVDVDYGDELLSLVTCSYAQDKGRFILVCRKVREGESEEDVIAQAKAVRSRR